MSPHIKHFPGQRVSEKIQLLIRKHWITDIKGLLVLFCIGVIPGFMGLGILKLLWDQGNAEWFWGAVIFFIAYILFVSLITYIHWLNEELDLIIVTDQRIISHEQIDLFHRQISETHITQLEDVKGIENGLLQSVLHYGSLELMTSSNDVFFLMKNVNQPYENARHLLDIRDQLNRTSNAK